MADSSAGEPLNLEQLDLEKLIGRKWVTIQQFARLLDVTYRTARRWVQDGKVRSQRVGGQYRIYEQELKRFIMEGNSDSSGRWTTNANRFDTNDET